MREKPGKRELNKARKRAEIVAIAARSFMERGYAATTMSAIADELGGSKTTLWAHFGSKQELFVAVLDDRVERFAHELECAVDASNFTTWALRKLCLRLIDQLLVEGSARLYGLIITEGERFPEIVEAFYARGPKRLQANIRKFFEIHFAPADAAELSRLVLNAILGFRSAALMCPDRPSRREREHFVDTLLARLQLEGIEGDTA